MRLPTMSPVSLLMVHKLGIRPLSGPYSRAMDVLTAGLVDPCEDDDGPSTRTYDNAPAFMALHVERTGPTTYSVGHYFEQNGDLVADPEIELVRDREAWLILGATLAIDRRRREALHIDENGLPAQAFPRMYRDLMDLVRLFLRSAVYQQGIRVPSAAQARAGAPNGARS